MTLPKGFGSFGRCKICLEGWIVRGGMGERFCDNPNCAQYSKSPSKRSFFDRHEDLAAFLIIMSIIAVIAIVVFGLFSWHDSAVKDVQNIISGYNCNDLAEYVADKKEEYYYAEHRYEWLCVNEQVKEFQ